VVDHTIKCTPPSDFQQILINADTTKKRSAKFILTPHNTSGVAVVPDNNGDELIFNGVFYRIDRVDPIYTGNTIAAYKVEVMA
jgi:hypothetical protein